MLKKRRIALLILIFLANYYHIGRKFKNFVTTKRENWRKRMTMRWAIRFNPEYGRQLLKKPITESFNVRSGENGITVPQEWIDKLSK
mmetsp:Transcript_22306/g.34511  ORF Transcript_22306/g.34511 Transcript_22306/m.34511 type:complete len:87 (-) Transcript_22306:620-880(-)